MIVGFKNDNKPRPHNWDHVHEQPCSLQYVVPPLTARKRSVTAAVRGAVAGAARVLCGSSVVPSREATFAEKAAELGFDADVADDVLQRHGGDVDVALNVLTAAWLRESREQIQATDLPAALPAAELCGEGSGTESSSEELPPEQPDAPAFSSDDARRATFAVFKSFVASLLPKPQSDGSFKDGDAELLDALMVTPIVLALPRAERLADLVKPAGGWDSESLEQARDFFALAAAGVQFLIFIPIITHRQQLARSPLFAVKNANGETVGVRDCCPTCRCNTFVNTTDGQYNIQQKKEISRNGVRFLYSMSGSLVPVSRSSVCRNAKCPANVKKLEARGLTWADDSKPLPRGKARDGKAWPSTKFSTHTSEYIALIREVDEALACLYTTYSIFNEGGCDASLAAKLMQTEATAAALCRDVRIIVVERERAALQRYIAYMREQQLQLDSSLPQLPSALELSRPASTDVQRLTTTAVAAAATATEADHIVMQPVSSEAVSNFFRRFLALRPSNLAAVADSDEDETATTAPTVAAPGKRAVTGNCMFPDLALLQAVALPTPSL